MKTFALHLSLFFATALVVAHPFVDAAQATEQTTKLTAADAANGDSFGSSVAIDGLTALVGAPQHEDTADGGDNHGAAYIFEGDPDDPKAWTEFVTLLPPDQVPNARFGNAVALSGSTALVGAYLENGSVGGAQGAAYVFERGTGSWDQMVELIPITIEQGDNFGVSVALDGGRAVVGAYHDDDAGLTSGSAYVFERNGAGEWNQVVKLVGDDTATQDVFGTSVAIHGDTVLVGAPQHNHGGSNTGAVYVFQLVDEHWIQVDELRAFDPEAGAYFGHSVSLDGSTALIGAYNDDGAGEQNSGAAFVFARNAGGVPGWFQVKELIASDGASGDNLGWSVALSGSTALVGAVDDDSVANNAGAVYIFQRDQGGSGQWGEDVEFVSDDLAAGDDFGSAVAIRGGSALIGAPSDDHDGISSGSAYVFAVDLPPAPRLTIPVEVPAVVDESVEVPVTVDTQTTFLTGTTFSIDYDAVCLDFDPTDADFDGIPDAATLHVPPSFGASVHFDLGDADGELDLSVIDPLYASSLSVGPVVTLTFTPTCVPTPPDTIIAPVSFSTVPMATFWNDAGQEVPGDTEGGSVEISAAGPMPFFEDDFETGDVSAWSSSSP